MRVPGSMTLEALGQRQHSNLLQGHLTRISWRCCKSDRSGIEHRRIVGIASILCKSANRRAVLPVDGLESRLEAKSDMQVLHL